MEEFAVIVAGGSGSRMNSKLPKQFIEVGSLPILMHTINRFIAYSPSINIVLVLPKSETDTWLALCQKHNYYPQNISLVNGGATRFQSCYNGIKAILALNKPDALVAIHDGVRLFVSSKIIKDGFALAHEKGTAVASVESKDSIRMIDLNGSSNTALPRQQIRIIQTPQVFRLNILKKAYSIEENPNFTDDASVVEKAGFDINLFEGDYTNIKITTESDLDLASLFLKKNKNAIEK
jgi:2-C-methyl-D-erythritol 4-phosphate cytidylyltransferase